MNEPSKLVPLDSNAAQLLLAVRLKRQQRANLALRGCSKLLGADLEKKTSVYMSTNDMLRAVDEYGDLDIAVDGAQSLLDQGCSPLLEVRKVLVRRCRRLIAERPSQVLQDR